MNGNYITETCARCDETFSHRNGFVHLTLEGMSADQSRFTDRLVFCNDCIFLGLALMTNENAELPDDESRDEIKD